MYELACTRATQAEAKLPAAFSASLYGNPEDIIKVQGNYYTPQILEYFQNYIYCYPFISFEKIKVIVELGPGLGKQVEVLKKLYPHLTIILSDLPSQLYVCEQYLKSVFPQDVISYRETRHLETLRPESGKIYILGNWKFSLIEKVPVDLFWNAASFQEMEPDIVLNYLRYVNNSAHHVFLQERMTGKGIAKQKGKPGVLQKTTLEHYQKGLSGFQLVDISPAVKNIGYKREYSNSFWKKKKS